MSLAPRYVTTGRANPWSSPPPRRFRAMRPTKLEPMETETEWPFWLKVMVAAFAVPAAMLLIGGM